MTEQLFAEYNEYIQKFFNAQANILDGQCEVLNYSKSFLQVKVNKEHYIKIKTFENYLEEKKLKLYGIYFLDDKICIDIEKPVIET